MNDAEAYLKSGIAHYQNGDYDRAMEEYNKAIELNPNYAGAMVGLAVVNLLKGDRQSARMWAKRALEKKAYLSEKQVDVLNELLNSLE